VAAGRLPAFALGAAIIGGRERATAAKIGGILLAAAGALLIVAHEGLEGAAKSVIGDLLILANSHCYALYLVLSKPMMARLSARRVITRMFSVGTVLMLPIALWPMTHQNWLSISPRAWLGLLLVIVGPTVAAYLLNAWALAYVDSSVVATYTYLQPPPTHPAGSGRRAAGGRGCRRSGPARRPPPAARLRINCMEVNKTG